MTKTTRQYEAEIAVLRLQFDQSVATIYEHERTIARLESQLNKALLIFAVHLMFWSPND